MRSAFSRSGFSMAASVPLPAALAPGEPSNFIRGQALLEQPLAFGFEGAGGADAHALPAEHTGGGGHGLVKERADLGFETAPGEVDGVGVLGVLGAHLHAAPAQHALGVIADVHRVIIQQGRLPAFYARKTPAVRPVIGDKSLYLGGFAEIDSRIEHLQDGAPAALDP